MDNYQEEIKMLTEEDLKEIIAIKTEDIGLDFKATMYNLKDDTSKTALIKDVMAMANSFYENNSYIVIGVKEKVGTKEILGITEVKDQVDYESFVNSKVEPSINFYFYTLKVDDKLIGVFDIKNSKNKFHMINKKIGGLEEGDSWIRENSRNRRVIRSDFDQLKSNESINTDEFVYKKLSSFAERIKKEQEKIRDIYSDYISTYSLFNIMDSVSYDDFKNAILKLEEIPFEKEDKNLLNDKIDKCLFDNIEHYISILETIEKVSLSLNKLRKKLHDMLGDSNFYNYFYGTIDKRYAKEKLNELKDLFSVACTPFFVYQQRKMNR